MSHGRQTSGFHEMAGLTVVLPNPWRIRLQRFTVFSSGRRLGRPEIIARGDQSMRPIAVSLFGWRRRCRGRRVARQWLAFLVHLAIGLD